MCHVPFGEAYSGPTDKPIESTSVARAILDQASNDYVRRFGSLHDFCYPVIYGLATELAKRSVTEEFATLLHNEAKRHLENNALRVKFEGFIYGKRYSTTKAAHNLGELVDDINLAILKEWPPDESVSPFTLSVNDRSEAIGSLAQNELNGKSFEFVFNEIRKYRSCFYYSGNKLVLSNELSGSGS